MKTEVKLCKNEKTALHQSKHDLFCLYTFILDNENTSMSFNLLLVNVYPRPDNMVSYSFQC